MLAGGKLLPSLLYQFADPYFDFVIAADLYRVLDVPLVRACANILQTLLGGT
jgi:hypothetical protein